MFGVLRVRKVGSVDDSSFELVWIWEEAVVLMGGRPSLIRLWCSWRLWKRTS